MAPRSASGRLAARARLPSPDPAPSPEPAPSPQLAAPATPPIGRREALERLGRKDEARAVAARLAVTWQRADADFPPAAELRALEGRLGR